MTAAPSDESAAVRRGHPEGPAEVIPDEDNQRLAVAECPDCGWQGGRRRAWSTAQEDADRHNKTGCPTRDRATPTLP